MMSEHESIRRAIDAAGSQQKLSRASGLSQQHISKLLKGERGMSAEAAIAISQATGGKVRIADLIPDVFRAVSAEVSAPAEAAQ